MRRVILSVILLLFLSAVLILRFCGGSFRAALSPKVEAVHPQIAADGGRFLERAVPSGAVYSDEAGVTYLWLAAEDESSGEKCYIAKKEPADPGEELDGYVSVRTLPVTALVIVSDPAAFTEGQRVEIREDAP